MAYLQKNIPRPNKIYTFSLKDFSGGLNNFSDEPKENEAVALLNMSFVDDILMEKRKGQEYFDEFKLDDEVVFIDEFKPYTDSDVLIRATKSKVYFNEAKVADVQGRISGTNHLGKYVFADGVDIYVYGKFPQTESTYEKIIGTAIDDYVLMRVVSPADGHPKLDTSHVRGVTRYDYTNKKIFYEPCENEVKDEYKGANKVPEKVKYIVSHNGRLFVSGAEKDDDNVFISDVHNLYYFPVGLPIQLPPNSDRVVGLNIFDNKVIIGRENDIYAIGGNTNRHDYGADLFNLKRLNTHVGFANHNAVDIVNNYLFFLGSDGKMYALGSTKLDERLLITNCISKKIDIIKSPINLNIDDIKNATSIFYDDEWYVSIKDKVLIYSFKHKSWTLYNNLHARSFYVLDNKLIWGNKNGNTAMFSDVYLDFGIPYQCYWYSKRFNMNDSVSFKQFKEFFLVAHTYEDWDSIIDIVFEIDYSDVKNKTQIQNQISIWGKSKWGDRFINQNINASVPVIIGRRGRNIRFKFSNGYFPHGEVETYFDLQYYEGRKEGVLVKVLDEDKYYLYTDFNWKPMENEDLNQRMKIYEINGDYEMRGKR